ncbi:MAG: adenosylcobinamide-phosphate synthase CbiB [Candidatus Pacebacteria bacterium]|nr:adenosylcobinamide-phosphate synthase CbiB [Candidatus Paceibacterota bacterium]
MNEYIFILAVSFFLDLILKDPKWLYHPVQAIGFLAEKIEKFFRFLFPKNLRLAGILFLFFLEIISVGTVCLIILKINDLGNLFSLIFKIYVVYSFISLGSLLREEKKIRIFLKKGEIEKARKTAQGMVSRDLSKEGEQGIIRATIESTAENISDGIIAPIFYYVLGGPVLMTAYKTANTLDSMVGYKNERYMEFGWAAAKFDDLINLIPARITGFLVVLSAFLFRDNYKESLKAWIRDGQKGPSPNGGIAITAFAGAREISLGGPCLVNGKIIDIPFVGGKKKVYGKEELLAVEHYVLSSSFLGLLLAIGWLYFKV